MIRNIYHPNFNHWHQYHQSPSQHTQCVDPCQPPVDTIMPPIHQVLSHPQHLKSKCRWSVLLVALGRWQNVFFYIQTCFRCFHSAKAKLFAFRRWVTFYEEEDAGNRANIQKHLKKRNNVLSTVIFFWFSSLAWVATKWLMRQQKNIYTLGT